MSGAHKFGQSVVLDKAVGTGIKVDTASPDWGWIDIIGFIKPDPAGVNSPTLSAFRGGSVRDYAYAAGDKIDMTFHVRHDHVPGSDIYLHAHWGHNGTAISGDLVLDFYATYAARDGTFSAEIAPTLTLSGLTIGAYPQYCHPVSEIQLSAASPSATQIDSDDLTVDGIIEVNLTVDTIPTITGGSPNQPFIFTCDLHVKSRGIGTKNSASPFYS